MRAALDARPLREARNANRSSSRGFVEGVFFEEQRELPQVAR